MGLREIKARARRSLHKAMGVPAVYYETTATAPRLVTVRLHSKYTQQGDLKGTNLSYAEKEEVAPKLLFMVDEVAMPKRGGKVIISSTEGYTLGQTEPVDFISIKVDVIPLKKEEIALLKTPEQMDD